MKFHSWWDLQTPQFKASVGSVDDVRAGYVAGYSYGHSDCRKRMAQIERENKELRAKVADLESAQEITVPDDMQEWAGMDGATAFHLIERHADNWSDAGKMMHEWLSANIPQPKEGE